VCLDRITAPIWIPLSLGILTPSRPLLLISLPQGIKANEVKWRRYDSTWLYKVTKLAAKTMLMISIALRG